MTKYNSEIRTSKTITDVEYAFDAFDGCDYFKNTFKGVTFRDCLVCDTSFLESKFSDVSFIRCHFVDCVFDQSEITETTLYYCTFEGCTFDDAVFPRSTITHTAFTERTSFVDADLSGATFNYVDFGSADLSLVNFGTAHFNNCTGDGEYLKTLKINRSHVTYTATHITIGNMTMPLDEWKELCTPAFSRFLLANRLDNRMKVWAEDLTLLNDLVARFPALPTKDDQ